MRLPDTPEMKELFRKIRPYLDKIYNLLDDAPEEMKEYRRLGKNCGIMRIACNT